MYDAWRAYLEVAMGLTQASRRKAEQIARDLIGRGGATASQLQTMAEELLAAGRANREALAKLVRYELERALGAVGLATADEVRGLEERVHRLEREMRAAGLSAAAPAAPQAPGTQAPHAAETAAKAPARKAAAKKATKTATRRAPAAKKAAGRTRGTSREQA
ncbi:MAG: hypothetical protein FWJ70_11480 [Micromonosporaceae bacterium]|jgi:polyhydroxyalkanoate synthesis regulator phasin